MRRHPSSLSGKFAEDASRYRARFQGFSGHSDSANWPGYKAEPNHNNVARRCRVRIQNFLGGGALVSCSTSTPIKNTSCIRKPQFISGGGEGVRTPCTLPLDPPLRWADFLLFLKWRNWPALTAFHDIGQRKATLLPRLSLLKYRK